MALDRHIAPSPPHDASRSGDFVEHPPRRCRAGDVLLGKYRLLRELGSGGMGAVWVAHHQQLDVQVAVKLLHPGLSEPTVTSRFTNEARILARLEHPAIVRIIDFDDTDQKRSLLVMELLRGESLAEVLAREGHFSPTAAVQMLLPVAAGLATAHDRRVAHRDLKPDNVFVASLRNGLLQPKLIDFGIARSLDAGPNSRLTRSGGVVGSPEYMAPEQAAGDRNLDHRVDIWAFCALLYECASGQRLYPMEDCYERVLRQIIEEPPTPLSAHGIDEPELWAILERGLQKKREARWPDMHQLGAALSGWLMDRGITSDVTEKPLASQWGPPPRLDRTDESSSEKRKTARARRNRPSRVRLVAMVAGAAAGFGVAWSGVHDVPLQWVEKADIPGRAIPSEPEITPAPATPANGAPSVRAGAADHVPSRATEPSKPLPARAHEDVSQHEAVVGVPASAPSKRSSGSANETTRAKEPPAATPETAVSKGARKAVQPANGTGSPSVLTENSVEVFDDDLGF